ncbi:MAG TPA: nuclear transport factor 2 family protein [Thermoleophilaceae bacterium]|jgi:ketosteroid isomerase-like protein|nr:nuclear transport factor 2 family protein [Thermoleophilaceae bacterium]
MSRPSSAAYVTAVLQFLQALNRNDLDACERFLDPQVEWHSACTYSGRAAVRKMLESYSERFTRPQVRPEDFRAAGDHVLMVVGFHEGDPEAPPRHQRQSWIADMNDDGLVRRVLSYPTPADAGRAFEALSGAAPKVHA